MGERQIVGVPLLPSVLVSGSSTLPRLGVPRYIDIFAPRQMLSALPGGWRTEKARSWRYSSADRQASLAKRGRIQKAAQQLNNP
jgi:hypothetical protein